jgi:hypothetical protein
MMVRMDRATATWADVSGHRGVRSGGRVAGEEAGDAGLVGVGDAVAPVDLGEDAGGAHPGQDRPHDDPELGELDVQGLAQESDCGL